MSEIIMSVENLTKKFPVSGGKFLTACDDISFHVRRGETIGIVGESGCGRIIFHGEDISRQEAPLCPR